LKGNYSKIVNQIKHIFAEKKIDVVELILNLCTCDAANQTVFSTDEAFVKVTNTTQLFHEIGKYCSMYDYELLLALVESTDCKEAIKLLDDFSEQLKDSILRNLDLLSEDGELKDPPILPGSHTLKIKYVGGKCTLKNNEIIKMVVYECFHLERVSVTFRGAQEGCVTFIYQISSAVKSYLLQYKVTGEDAALLSKHNIVNVLVDDEKLTMPPKHKVLSMIGMYVCIANMVYNGAIGCNVH